MRKMNEETRKQIEWLSWWVMANSTSEDYASRILEHRIESGNTFMDDVIEDVIETSGWNYTGHFNEDDIRLAIGRVFMTRLEIVV